MKSILVATFLGIALTSSTSKAYFEAHEWGTFTSLVGSSGETQNGMYHEDERLPNFVHPFGTVLSDVTLPPQAPEPRPTPCHSKACFSTELLDRSVITQKMETPVIYFYSDTARAVSVNVRFPEGVITETFPAPVATYPRRDSISTIRGGETTFNVSVLSPGSANSLPYVASDNIYGHARLPKSNTVRARINEYEKFIFYRGIGRFQPAFTIESAGNDVMLSDLNSANRPQAAFLVHVDDRGDARMLPIRNLDESFVTISSELTQELTTHGAETPNVLSTRRGRTAIERALATAGLSFDEATAMLNTWEHGYLKVPGLRLLYILPRAEVDSVLPLTITPQPDQVERVFVGRIEIVTQKTERDVLMRVQAERDAFKIESLGRFAEPILRAVSTSATKIAEDDRHLLRRLIRRAARMESTPSVLQ